MIKLITLQSEFPSLKSEMIIVHSMVFLLAISYILSQNEVFAQMESMTIHGPKHPLCRFCFFC